MRESGKSGQHEARRPVTPRPTTLTVDEAPPDRIPLKGTGLIHEGADQTGATSLGDTGDTAKAPPERSLARRGLRHYRCACMRREIPAPPYEPHPRGTPKTL